MATSAMPKHLGLQLLEIVKGCNLRFRVQGNHLRQAKRCRPSRRCYREHVSFTAVPQVRILPTLPLQGLSMTVISAVCRVLYDVPELASSQEMGPGCRTFQGFCSEPQPWALC